MFYKSFWVVSFVAVLGLTGCDQMKSKFGDLFSDPTPEKTLGSMQKSLAEGKVDEAITNGEKFVEKYADPGNKVRGELVKIYLEKNDASAAVRHMQGMVTNETSGSSSNLVGAPVTSQIPEKSISKDEVTPGKVISVDGASVRIGPTGTEVRAGDAVVRTTK